MLQLISKRLIQHCSVEVNRRRGGEREGCRPRDVTALTTPGPPQWPFSEGADAPAPLSAAPRPAPPLARP